MSSLWQPRHKSVVVVATTTNAPGRGSIPPTTAGAAVTAVTPASSMIMGLLDLERPDLHDHEPRPRAGEPGSAVGGELVVVGEDDRAADEFRAVDGFEAPDRCQAVYIRLSGSFAAT